MTHDEEEDMRIELQYQAYTARRKREADCPEIKELADLKIAHAKLEAKLARLTAEVERLTPRPMTLEEIAEVFNEHLIHDRDDWDADDCTVFRRHGDDRIEAGDATLMAQGLLRDAAPTSTRSEAGR